MTLISRSIALNTPLETQSLARHLAPVLRQGDVMLLEGPIGAGKTHFARSLIQALLPVPEDVPSPTFTLVQVYDGSNTEIWHADLYRLSAPDEVVELGLTDAFEDAICLVEWPDRLADLAPENALKMSLKLLEGEGQRQLTVSSTSERWKPIIKALSK
ncbi:MAG: tRNA (adenosine(37)-N6)-threonylcarbamoyltransferase complex ATPase subunit type 1 TsaE [Shimia sp.]|nr:tRNA (adenosine(37)-N6)-threonylcarbamoyltransferase complex ATPase subunit type 1 TsaE [Shimia sp.]MCP4825155.1 tRNA (adenosine(37)-N6)-threonylcarbamoyltransferase complex ATPase subunit type 1 TsaE [Shimia sp.]|mmetsp:Transcript_16044/g.24937  ORF Transcript_16044/g.24937 Transcript_16044/m.24937 type:complete len:158 (-) Transcript_16044:397-870(-)